MPDPSAIVLVLSTTLISSLCDLENSGVDVVGTHLFFVFFPYGIYMFFTNQNINQVRRQQELL